MLMNLELLILIVSNAANLLLGAVIFLRDIRSKINRNFVLLSASFVLWTTFNYLADHASDYNLLLTRLTFVSSVAVIFYLNSLIRYFPNEKINDTRYNQLQTPIAWLVALISFSPLLVESVQKQPGQGVELTVGFGYYIFIAYVVQAVTLLILDFLRQRKNSKSQTEKTQLKIILWGILFYAVFAIASNLVLPTLVNSWSSSKFGPVFSLLFVAMTAYAIIKHGLLDIRLVVVRALGYVLTVATIGFIYGFFAFGLVGRIFFTGQEFNITQQIVYTVLAIILVFTFPPIQRFFNKLTNSLFYQDAYDQQALLNRLGTLFALEIDIKKIARQSLDVICTEMKLQHGRLITINDDQTLRVTAHGDVSTDVTDNKVLRGLKQKVTSVDDADLHIAHKEELRALDVSVIVRLVTKEGLVGYLLLGPKKSGNIYSNQDVDVLTIISNEMAVAVQNSLLFERITQFNITLQERVNEATRRLRRTNEKLKALDETKDDFISMASHQLRTPLTSIKGYISMVMEEDAGKISKQQKDMLSQAFFSSQRMVYLIADLLNVSRLKTGKFIIEPVKVNLGQVVPQELEQLKETAASRSLTLTLDMPKTFPDVMLDETKTRQVIMNFVDNAIYYTPAGGHITVRLIDNPTNIELRVEDDGIGVAKSDQAHLFTKFYRAGNARKARPDGTGLGLFMAKKVIVAQGGSLIFESQEGKGSTFGFTFSKSHIAPPKEAAPAKEEGEKTPTEKVVKAAKKAAPKK